MNDSTGTMMCRSSPPCPRSAKPTLTQCEPTSQPTGFLLPRSAPQLSVQVAKSHTKALLPLASARRAVLALATPARGAQAEP